MRWARLLAIVAGVFNIVGALLAAYDTDVGMLAVSLAAAALCFYGWLFFTEEAEKVREDPEYRRLAMRLRWELKEENMPPGAKLPSTRELSEKHHATRRTVSRALHLLADEGLITVVHGRGCYVREPDGNRGPRSDDGPKGRIECHLMKTTSPGDLIPTVEILTKQCRVTPEQARRVVGTLVRKGMLRHNRGKHYRI